MQRLLDVLDLIRNDGDMQTCRSASAPTGIPRPAAIRCAAQRDTQVKALLCHGGLIDRAGVQSLELLVAPLLMLFEPDDMLLRRPTCGRHGAPGCPHEKQHLALGDSPIPAIADWFARPRQLTPPGDDTALKHRAQSCHP